MLPIPGTQPLSPFQRLDDAAFGLRLNQRLTAQVLQIATDHVVLAVDGVPVVARLTSPEQAAILAEQRTAQFIVRGFSEQALTLQLVDRAGNAAGTPPPPNMLAELLRQVGLSTDEASMEIARALIDHGLPVTPELVNELTQALAAVKPWEAGDAQRAAALKAAGLPLSLGILTLTADAPGALVDAFARLQDLTRTLAATSLPSRLAALTQNALQVLDGLVVDCSAPTPAIGEQLHATVQALGHSLERELAALAPGTALAELPAQKGLLALAQLRGELAQAAPSPPQAEALVGALDQFLDAARLLHFKNTPPELIPAAGHWLTMTLPLANPAGPVTHLHVAYRPDDGTDSIDPAHTRLVLQVALEDGQAVEVDLSVVERRIGAWVTTSDEGLRAQAEAELPELRAGLHRLGFALSSARCCVGRVAPPTRPAAPLPTTAGLSQVNVEA